MQTNPYSNKKQGFLHLYNKVCGYKTISTIHATYYGESQANLKLTNTFIYDLKPELITFYF